MCIRDRLISGRFPAVAWLAAAGLFSAFSAVNILLLTQGVTRCGCLGYTPTSPGWMPALATRAGREAVTIPE
ncbi:MAG: hypothetical protein N2039_01260, partial [Gemmataceae bacterium]|nr:hypothetical protein [Gemmataceae bacterium]